MSHFPSKPRDSCIIAPNGQTQGLVSAFVFGNGPKAQDKIGKQLSGAASTYVPLYTPVGPGQDCSAAASYIDILDTALKLDVNEGSVAFGCYATSNWAQDSWQTVMGFRIADVSDSWLEITPDNKFYYFTCGLAGYSDTGQTPVAGEYAHFVVTWSVSKNKIELWKNGFRILYSTGVASAMNAPTGVKFGWNHFGTFKAPCSLQYCYVFDRSLGIDQITAIADNPYQMFANSQSLPRYNIAITGWTKTVEQSIGLTATPAKALEYTRSVTQGLTTLAEVLGLVNAGFVVRNIAQSLGISPAVTIGILRRVAQAIQVATSVIHSTPTVIRAVAQTITVAAAGTGYKAVQIVLSAISGAWRSTFGRFYNP